MKAVRVEVMRVGAFFFRCAPGFLLEFLWGYAALIPGSVGVFVRYCLLKNLAAQCGDNVYVARFVVVKNWASLSVGGNVSIHEGCYIDAYGGVTIGDDVSIAHQVSIVSFDHGWSDFNRPIKYNPSKPMPIKIDNDVWIGCGARVLAGSHLATRSVLAAGAVVRGVFPSGVVLGGVPARVIKRIDG